MRHRLKGRKLGMPTAHRQATARSMVTSLFTYGRIVTTVTRAKEFRGEAEHLITLAKRGGLVNYRRALGYLRLEEVARKLFNDIAGRFKDRPGGYTRVIRLGGSRWEGKGHGKWAANRLGDNAPRAVWELVVTKEPDEEKRLAGIGAAKAAAEKPEGKTKEGGAGEAKAKKKAPAKKAAAK